MPGKRRSAPTLWTSRNRFVAAVVASILLLTTVGVWSQLSRKPDPLSITPQAEPIFPEGSTPGDLPPTDDLPAEPSPGAVSSAAPVPGPTSRTPGLPPTTAPPAGEGGGDQGGGDQGGDDGGGDQVPPPPPRTTPPPEQPPPPPPAATQGPFTSRYTTTESDARTFHARVFLTNRGSSTRDWSVQITYASADQVDVGRTVGAIARTSGNTTTFSGFSARSGQTEIFGFDATKGTSGTVRPIICRIDGRDCDIR